MLRRALRQLLRRPAASLVCTLATALAFVLIALAGRRLGACLPGLLSDGGTSCEGAAAALAFAALFASALIGAALAATLGDRPLSLERLDGLASGGLLGGAWLLAVGLSLGLAGLGLRSGLRLATDQVLAAAAVIAATLTPALLVGGMLTSVIAAALWKLASEPGARLCATLAAATLSAIHAPARLLAAAALAAIVSAPLLLLALFAALRVLITSTAQSLPWILLLALLSTLIARLGCAFFGLALLDDQAAPTEP